MRSQPRACECRCHNEDEGDRNAYLQLDRAGWEVYHAAVRARYYHYAATDDVTDAGAACPKCIDAHCPALLSRLPNPYHKPEPSISASDATAYTEDGEGPET